MARTPTYLAHTRFECSGTIGPFGSAFEIFSFSIKTGQVDGAGEIGLNYYSDVMDDLAAFFGDPNSHISGAAVLTKIKAALITPNGTWSSGKARLERDFAVRGSTASAPSGAMTHAPQVALGVTLRTAFNNARQRGRFFIPTPNVPVNVTDGLIAAGDATAVANSVANLIHNINEMPGFDSNNTGVIVASTFGLNTPVNGVSCGRVLDTIRSRRSAPLESYVTVPIP
jgi:hypothetical protein